MADYLPLHRESNSPTYAASADIVGGRLVEITGPNAVAHAAAGSTKWVGVAARDTKAGEDVTVFVGGVQLPTASGAIAAGDALVCADGGKVAANQSPTALTLVGIAQTSAADGKTVEAVFNR